MSESTRAKIVKSALKIVRNGGITKLTIADVADEASVSKGGLLYHFATKDDLIFGVLKDTVEQCMVDLAGFRERDQAPGGWMRALLVSTFRSPKETCGDIIAAILSTLLLSDRPMGKEMVGVYQSNLTDLTKLVASDGLDELDAAVIQMAIDGLMFNEAVGTRPFPPTLRKRFLERLREMTYQTVETAAPATELVET